MKQMKIDKNETFFTQCENELENCDVYADE